MTVRLTSWREERWRSLFLRLVLPRVHEIEIDKLAFGPAPEVLHVNDSVEWVNADIFQHTATAADGSFDVDLPAGAKGRTILKRAGVVDYFCRFHPGMQGRLEVAP